MNDDPRSDSEEEEERPRIKVTDRRLFDREGNLREDVAEDQSRTTSPHTPTVGAERPDPGTAGASGAGDRPGAGPDPGTPPGKPAGGAPGPGGPSRPGATSRPPAPEDRGFGGTASGAGPGPDEPPADEGIHVPGAETGTSSPADREAPSASDLPRDFSAFVESQYFEALLYLGAVPHPQTGERVQDLEFARYKIDLLGMIQEKTQGNLDDPEEQFLDKVLADLRMRFADAKRA